MAGKKDYESEAEKLLGPIAEENGVRIYDVEYVKQSAGDTPMYSMKQI